MSAAKTGTHEQWSEIGAKGRASKPVLLGCMFLGLLSGLSLAGCGPAPWNDPYPAEDQGKNIYYDSFAERLKHLDPARSYSSNEAPFLGAVYEAPLQYHYLKRPYTLEPLVARALPEPVRVDALGRTLGVDAPAEQVARSIYTVHIRRGIRYQPHPAFARGPRGELRYQNPSPADLEGVETLADFAHSGSRELVAEDFVYQIKRLAHPALHSPIFGLMSEHIHGLKGYADELESRWQALVRDKGGAGGGLPWLDLRAIPLAGARVLDRYTYRVVIDGEYPQFKYWLAMHFFAPVPFEVDRFFALPGMKERNLSLDTYPVGTGPYMLVENDPNRRIVLQRNPNFHGEDYPRAGEPGDADRGLLADAGRPLPFIDRLVYSLERESVPRWNKFLEGYYDTSRVGSDAFDQAVQLSAQGGAELTPSMRAKGIYLTTEVTATTFYTGFNMLDDVVGGEGESARLLRRAISIAVDYEEFVSIFLNGRGIPAQGPIPPGIFGYLPGREGINPYVYDWVNRRPRRKALAEAKALLARAGYPDGRDARNGRPLLLYLDIAASGPDDKARLDWWRKQFRKLGIQLVIRNTDYNRFQDKMRSGNAQVFFWGWAADYPDPENFLFLLYGPNGKVRFQGENAANYENPQYDRMFEHMKSMPDGPERLGLIQRMLEIVRRDAPWLWGFYSKDFSLYHSWVYNAKPNLMANNTLKYLRIDPKEREALRAQWNIPLVWPLWLLAGLGLLAMVPAWMGYRRRESRRVINSNGVNVGLG